MTRKSKSKTSWTATLPPALRLPPAPANTEAEYTKLLEEEATPKCRAALRLTVSPANTTRDAREMILRGMAAAVAAEPRISWVLETLEEV